MSGESRYNLGKKVSIISLLTNTILAVLKVVFGFIYSSKALVADGIHTVSDMISTLVVLLSMKFSHYPADEDHPYGHGKAEAIGTAVLASTLLVTGALLIKDAIISIYIGKVAIPGKIALYISVFSILTKEWLYRYTLKIGREIKSKGIIADAHHHRSDALSSVAALIGITGTRLGYLILDPLAGLVVALFIVKIGISILKEAINELMDGAPSSTKINNYKELARKVDGVLKVADIKVRSYGPEVFVDLSVVVNDHLSVIEGHQVAHEVKKEIIKADESVAEVMIHVDPEKVYTHEKRTKKN